MEEVITMSNEEINRHHIIRTVLERKLLQRKAAAILDLDVRQIRRLCAQVRDQGAHGVVHGLRGRPSNNRKDPELLEMALSAVHDPLWEGFGPTFAQEKLEQYYNIKLGKETLRQLMLRSDIWKVRRKGWRHRSWRARWPCIGMLVQLDGSVHDWFEGRGPKCVLLIFIDDATSRILYGEFVKVEDTLTLMRGTWNYLKKCGRCIALYVDKDSIYKVNTGSEGLLEDRITQYSRAMEELGIKVIFANSPQAKGRVERGFNTHQDRLIKELRLRGISNMADANRYLWGGYIPEHNKRFAVAPTRSGNAHRPLLAAHKLEEILSLRHKRTVCNDYTLSYRPGFLQILEHQRVRVRPGDKVEVEERLDGTRHVRFKGVYLNFKQVPKRPYRPYLVARPSQAKRYDDPRTKGVGSKPGPNHPWRRLFLRGSHKVGLPAATVRGL